ncbi:MAG: hypothetical protein RLZZ609_506 [Cyanobacteriota bacterium]|jgi:hypothetical protein
MSTLMLYSRQGCCLCEGLEERLRQILPPGALQVVDVDGDPALQARYGLSVPVLARAMSEEGGSKLCELPPVPPRLQGERLLAWLERHPSP